MHSLAITNIWSCGHTEMCTSLHIQFLPVHCTETISKQLDDSPDHVTKTDTKVVANDAVHSDLVVGAIVVSENNSNCLLPFLSLKILLLE